VINGAPEVLPLTVPTVESDRYFSVQLIDGYTFNFAYIGSRTTGNGGGSFLVAGPEWEGETPDGISGVFRSGTDLAWALYRTQLFSPGDLAGVEAVQAGYKAEPLSAFLGTEPPSPAPAIDFMAPLSPEEQRGSLAFFDVLNFVLRFAPVDPSEAALRERFARLGIVPGAPFDAAAFAPEVQAAIRQGMDDAWAEFAAFKAGEIDTGRTTSGDLFGTREFLQNNYLYRMAGAVLGIYGNSREEAMYPVYTADESGAPLDGSKRSYTGNEVEGAVWRPPCFEYVICGEGARSPSVGALASAARCPHTGRGLEPDRLVADLDAALVEQILNVPQREWEADVHHHRQANDLGARFEVLEGVGFGHLGTLLSPLPRLKPSSSDTELRATHALM
jgi:hypothetical protein